jgi:hypothetical protein
MVSINLGNKACSPHHRMPQATPGDQTSLGTTRPKKSTSCAAQKVQFLLRKASYEFFLPSYYAQCTKYLDFHEEK